MVDQKINQRVIRYPDVATTLADGVREIGDVRDATDVDIQRSVNALVSRVLGEDALPIDQETSRRRVYGLLLDGNCLLERQVTRLTGEDEEHDG